MKRASIAEIREVIENEILVYRQNDWCVAHFVSLFNEDLCDCQDCQSEWEVA